MADDYGPSSSDGDRHSDSRDDEDRWRYNDDWGMGTNIHAIERDCSRICARALAKCEPVKGGAHQVCILRVKGCRDAQPDAAESPQKKHRPEDADVELHVLQGILEEWSPVLHRQLKSWCASAGVEAMVININEFKPDVAEHFTRFLYQGNMRNVDSVPVQTLLEVARMGKFYDIPQLQELCITLLHSAKGQPPSVEDFKRADFNLEDLLRLGCDPMLLAASGFSLEQFLVSGPVNAWILKRANFNLKDIGNLISCSTLKESGSSWENLVDVGYSMTELKEAGATPSTVVRLLTRAGDKSEIAIGKMIRLRYSVEQLVTPETPGSSCWNRARFQQELSGSASILYDAGYTREDLITLGYTERLLTRSQQSSTLVPSAA